MVRQEVHLVHVEDASMGAGEQARRKPSLTIEERRTQIDRPHDAVFRRADRELDERRPARKKRSEGPRGRRLRTALFPTKQNPADLRVDRCQNESEAKVLLSDHRREREEGSTISVCLFGHLASSQPSASKTAERSTSSASSDASHIPRATASSKRSAIDLSAQGFDSQQNFLTSWS